MNKKLTITQTLSTDQVFKDVVFVSPKILVELDAKYIKIDDKYICNIGSHDECEDNDIMINGLIRSSYKLILTTTCDIKPISITNIKEIKNLELHISRKKNNIIAEIDEEEFNKELKEKLNNHVLYNNKELYLKYNNYNIYIKCIYTDIDGGLLVNDTNINLKYGDNVINKNDHILNFKSDFNFEKMGIGGLDKEFNTIFRQTFSSRLCPDIVKKMGIKHVKGMLLYGPPGCGKTLIARQIANILNVDDNNIKIVNGPEVLNKMIGESEENMRKLFIDAEIEYKQKGDHSSLHIIIFDEIDSIMKVRGKSDNLGVGDNLVNQLLTKIDGVDALPNILVIGMTNRKDMIDPAVLRAGRLEVHIEVPLPDKKGREQILNIKIKDMIKNNMISDECINRIPELSELTKNYTGAELESLIGYAAKYALSRNINIEDLNNISNKEEAYILQWTDIIRTIENDIIPQFGNKIDDKITQYFRNGIINYGESFDIIWKSLLRLIKQVKESTMTPILSVLLEGNKYVGKTALAVKIATLSNYPYIRIISADQFIGLHEDEKCNIIQNIFMDGYKSPLSIIILDDIERLIGYCPVGPRFEMKVLQTLMILIKKYPTIKDSRCMIIATSGTKEHMDNLGIVEAFSVVQHIPELQTKDEIKEIIKNFNFSRKLYDIEIENIINTINNPIGIKQLAEIIEMCLCEVGTDIITPYHFNMCLCMRI